MKKILLIGKDGQLGGEIIKDASVFGFEIIGVDKDELDITNKIEVNNQINKIKPDILINTAAYNAVSKCEKNPMLAMEVNFIAVQNLAKACRENNIVFVTYSTDYVFDGEKGLPYEENDIPNPLQMYGASKLAGECAVLSLYPEETFIIRTCGLYGGEKGSPEKGNFVLNIIKESIDKKFVEVSSDQIVSPTYAGDLSKSTLKLLQNMAKPGIFHLVNEGHCSWHEFAEEVFKLAHINKTVKPINRNGIGEGVKRPRFSVLKNKKAKLIGIELPAWQEGLKSYFAFLNQN